MQLRLPHGILTDAIPMQIDVAVNAPEAGTIKEFLVNEEDTVTVGQDLVRIELGGAPAEGSAKVQADESQKDAHKEENPSVPKSEEPTKEDKSQAVKEEQSKPAPAPEPQRDVASSQKQPSPQPSKSTQSSGAAQDLGSRGERKVGQLAPLGPHCRVSWLTLRCRSR